MWTPPKDQVVTDNQWKPPSDQVVSEGPGDQQQSPPEPWYNRAADTINNVMSFGSRPEAFPGEAQQGLPGTLAAIQKPFTKAGEATAEYLGSKFPNHPFIGAAAGTAVTMANPANWLSPEESVATPLATPLENAANVATKSANTKWFKATGGTLPVAKELGAEETLRLGRLARDKGIVTPLNNVESQTQNISNQLSSSGKRLGELRAIGDLYGNSPEASKIVQIIEQDISPKYKTGIKSGEQGDLRKAIEEVLKLEPTDKLTQGEEFRGFMNNEPPPVSGSFEAKTNTQNPVYPMSGSPAIESQRQVPFTQNSYEQFRAKQEDPNYIPEYDFRRPTTFNEVAKVATDINKHAKGQSKMLQPSGAATDVANTISKLNDEALMKSLPADKGAEYQQQLSNYADLSKLDRMNELKSAFEAGGSRNFIVNNIVNQIHHKFGYQLSGAALDAISNVLKGAARTAKNPLPTRGFSAAVMNAYMAKRNRNSGGNDAK